jgi:hypothetical protein
MSLALIASTILLSSVLSGMLAYAVITISELKRSRTMWQQAYTKLAIEFELSKAGK